jgi:hypothetical protein
MFERFRRGRGGTDGAVSAGEAERERETTRLQRREPAAVAEHDAASERRAGERRFTRREEPPARRRPGEPPVRSDNGSASGTGATRTSHAVAPATMAAVRDRQRERFGGFSWGSDFFGFLCAIGLASIILGILRAAGVSFDVVERASRSGDPATIGAGGILAMVAIVAVAWFAGGYVAGRMARFDGVRQGVGVWLWTILFVVAVALLAAIGGSKYDVLASLNLPSLPVDSGTLTTGGAIAAGAALLVTLLFAVLGGKAGERFHRRVDRVAHDGA